MKHFRIIWILRDNPHQHQHFIDEGTKTREVASLWLWTLQWCLSFLFYPPILLHPFLAPLCISLIILHFCSQRDTRLREVTSAQRVYCNCIFSSIVSLNQHLSQLILSTLSFSSHSVNLDTFNVALSFKRHIDFNRQWWFGGFHSWIFWLFCLKSKTILKTPKSAE